MKVDTVKKILKMIATWYERVGSSTRSIIFTTTRNIHLSQLPIDSTPKTRHSSWSYRIGISKCYAEMWGDLTFHRRDRSQRSRRHLNDEEKKLRSKAAIEFISEAMKLFPLKNRLVPIGIFTLGDDTANSTRRMREQTMLIATQRSNAQEKDTQLWRPEFKRGKQL